MGRSIPSRQASMCIPARWQHEKRTMKLSNLKVLSIQNPLGIDTNGENVR